MSGRDDLTDAEREALVDWWDSDWPDDVDGVIGTLWDVVAGIVAGRVGEAQERAEAVLREFETRVLMQAARADAQWAGEPPSEGFYRTVLAVRGDTYRHTLTLLDQSRAAESPAESPGHAETGSGSQGARGAVEGAEWFCLHCGDSHETHEGDCCCHGHDEDSE